MIESDKTEVPDESGVERVLRAAGGRDYPAEALERSVHAEVHAAWRAAVIRRKRSRRQLSFAAAAAIAVIALGLWVNRSWVVARPMIMASVTRAEGAVNARPDSWMNQWISSGRWRAVNARQSLRSGEEVMTGAGGRAALTLPNGISLRLDRNTRIVLVDGGHIHVRNGAVYLDSGNGAGARALQINTPAGALNHLGTQYEVRLLKSGVRIRVREGQVELSRPSGVIERVHAGEQLMVAPTGNRERSAIDSAADEWTWVTEVAPIFDIEGRSLREFLNWVGRELGREIVFATPESAAEAARATLHGSIAGLTPAEALKAVLPTTVLRASQHGRQIIVGRQNISDGPGASMSTLPREGMKSPVII